MNTKAQSSSRSEVSSDSCRAEGSCVPTGQQWILDAEASLSQPFTWGEAPRCVSMMTTWKRLGLHGPRKNRDLSTVEADDGVALEDMYSKDGNFPQINIWV